MSRNLYALLALPFTMILAACGSSSGDGTAAPGVSSATMSPTLAAAPPLTSAPPVVTTPPVVQTSAASPPTTAAAAAAQLSFTMPAFRGMNLQAAQNKVQSDLGIFYSISHDLKGSRHQILDADWQVCTQTPAVGTKVSGSESDLEGKIDFGVVRTSERCP